MKHECSSLAMPSEDVISDIESRASTLNEAANLFATLSDRTRFRIVYALTFGKKNVCELAQLANTTHSNASHQMRTLRDNRIVDFEKVGKQVFYFLLDKHVEEIVKLALAHIEHNDCK